MNYPEEELSKVEQRLLNELLAFHATLPADGSSESGRWSRLTPRDRRRDASARAARRRRIHRIQNALVAAAFLAVVGVFIAHALPSPRALAATPRPLVYHGPPIGAPSGRQELLILAAAAERQPLAPTTHPLYAYTKTQGWYLDSQIGGGRTVSSVVPQSSESWLAPNGSGRDRTVRVNEDGSREVDDNRLSPGGAPQVLQLSTNPTVLARQLAVGHPASAGPVERFVALTDLARQQPIPAHAESAILRLLASTRELINRGSVIDRAGRPGVAVSLDSAYSGLPTRYTWIFDPHTGQLLGEEEMLTGNTGKLNVRTGSITSYTTYLTSGWVTNTSSRPSGGA